MTNRQFVKNLDDYFEMINDAFKDPLDIKWAEKGNKIIGMFIVNDNIYQIRCSDKGNDFWTCKFFYYDKEKNVMDPNLTGFERDKFRVLPTVKSGITYLIETKNPTCIIYAALDDSEARKKLYSSTSKEISKSHNLEYLTQGIGEFGEKQIFVLYKKNTDSKLLYRNIQSVVNDVISNNVENI